MLENLPRITGGAQIINELRSINYGLVLSYQRRVYSEEDAQKMASYYMAVIITAQGITAAKLTLSRLQKIFRKTKPLLKKL